MCPESQSLAERPDVSSGDNDRVRKGQVLATLDDSEVKSQVEVARSALQAAHATLTRVKTDKARAGVEQLAEAP